MQDDSIEEIERLRRRLGELAAIWYRHDSPSQDEEAIRAYHAIMNRLYDLGWDEVLDYASEELPRSLMPEEYNRRHPLYFGPTWGGIPIGFKSSKEGKTS